MPLSAKLNATMTTAIAALNGQSNTVTTCSSSRLPSIWARRRPKSRG